ncbi:hypothetical protein [Alistipes sp.]|uniref:hypothetical protein n=1 Tax=Alistipes sp. TaxID=1872444 RepID=UPI0025BCE0D5|nr:hypothetical protein [Alistipes sp.]
MSLLGFLGINICGCVNAQKKNEIVNSFTIDEKQPKNYYLLTMSSNGCNFRILINDIPIWGFWDEGAYSGSYPINHFIMKSGTQKLKVELYPAYTHEDLGINSEEPLYIEIKKRLDGQTLDDYVAVLTNPIPKIKKGIPYYEYECTFDAEVPYNISILDECIRLDSISNIEEMAVQKYNELKSMYERKDFSSFKEEFFIRNESIGLSNYYKDGGCDREMEDQINTMKKLYEHVAPIQDYEIKFYGDKKLILLYSKIDCTYAFRLDDGGDDIWPLPFFLGMRKGSDKLEIVF